MKSRRKKFTTMYPAKKLGTGGRFAALKARLAKKGAKDPAALAAVIGRKKYGTKKMSQLSTKGRKQS